MGGDDYVITKNSKHADAHKAAHDLDEQVTRLRAENADLRQELEAWWEQAHDEGCTNMKDCKSYGGKKECYRPRPEILQTPNAVVQARGAQTIDESDGGRPASRATEG